MIYKILDNNYHFDFYYDLNYEELITNLNKIKCWYDKEINQINNLYQNEIMKSNFENSLYISDRHSNIIKSLIQKVLDLVNIQKNFSCFLSNSFARGTNLFESDLDLNFIYNEDLKKWEELIDFCLCYVLDKYRDFIHDSYPHRTSNINFEGQNVTFTLHFKDKNINYDITKGNEKLMINYCFGNCQLDVYKKEIVKSRSKEHLYFQKNINETSFFDELFCDFLENEYKRINKEELNEQINESIILFTNEIKSFSDVDFTNMKKFKQYYKNIVYNKIFTVISFYKRLDIIKYKKLDLNNIYNYDNLLAQDYINKVIPYFGQVMQFSYLCFQLDIGFRTRYDKEIPDVLKDQFKEITTFNYDTLFYELANDIYKKSILELNKIKETL